MQLPLLSLDSFQTISEICLGCTAVLSAVVAILSSAVGWTEIPISEAENTRASSLLASGNVQAPLTAIKLQSVRAPRVHFIVS